jgi:hypothetical protein
VKRPRSGIGQQLGTTTKAAKRPPFCRQQITTTMGAKRPPF